MIQSMITLVLEESKQIDQASKASTKRHEEAMAELHEMRDLRQHLRIDIKAVQQYFDRHL